MAIMYFNTLYYYTSVRRRLPNKPNDPNKTHYLTDYYAKEEFGLPLVPFNNSDNNAFVKFYSMEPLPIKGIYIFTLDWFLKYL